MDPSVFLTENPVTLLINDLPALGVNHRHRIIKT